MSRIYTHPTFANVEVPQLDLLTFLFESEHSLAQDDTVLHVDANNPSNNITKAQLRDLICRVSHGLRTQYGIGANGPDKDVVTVITYGHVMVPAVLYGVIAAGGVYSAASPSSTVSELKRQVETTHSQAIVCGVEHEKLARETAKECGLPLRNVLLVDSEPPYSMRSLDGKVEALSQQRLPWQRITDPKRLKDSLIVILWSSGTTGLPKGVCLSHFNFVVELFITSYESRQWAQQQVAQGIELPDVQTRGLAHLPVSHIAGFLSYMMIPQYVGGEVIWMRKYRWEELLHHLENFTITSFYTVPSIFLRIAKSPEVKDHFKHVMGASTGAAPMDGELQKAANARLGNGTEIKIGQTWGLSETTGAVTAMPKGQSDDSGSVSPILPTIALRLVDDDYNDVEPGQEGELLVRGPVVTNGYYGNPEATRAAFHGEWFCSGDIGVFKDGKLYIVDRKKELLKYKGLQVAPAELEGLLFTHPKIKEAAVVGLPAPDDPGTDLPRAYVVLEDGASLTEEEVKRYVAERVAAYKQLRGGVRFVEEIPKNAIGKFLRRELRDRAKKEVGRSAKL